NQARSTSPKRARRRRRWRRPCGSTHRAAWRRRTRGCELEPRRRRASREPRARRAEPRRAPRRVPWPGASWRSRSEPRRGRRPSGPPVQPWPPPRARRRPGRNIAPAARPTAAAWPGARRGRGPRRAPRCHGRCSSARRAPDHARPRPRRRWRRRRRSRLEPPPSESDPFTWCLAIAISSSASAPTRLPRRACYRQRVTTAPRPGSTEWTRAVWANQLMASRALETVTKRFDAAGIDTLAVKGVVTAHTLYSDPAERPLADADVRIRPEDVARAADSAREAGWRIHEWRPAYGAFVVVVPGLSVPVDVESVIGAPGLCGMSIAEMLARATRGAGPVDVRVPEIHDHAVLMVVNVFKDKLA